VNMDLTTARYTNPAAVPIGLGELRRKGLTPRGLAFVALDPRGEVHVAVPGDLEASTTMKVGDKLSLENPWQGRFFHYDSVHRLPVGVLWNGDRRLHEPGNAGEVTVAIAEWLKAYGAKNVFLGCTPHQPGSWWTLNERAPSIALHERGFVDVVTSPTGLLARRIGEAQLYFLPYASFDSMEWRAIYKSPLGNVLLLERRIIGDRLVLSCQKGLVEVDVSAVPEVKETARVAMSSGFGVVGRVDGGAFAVTCGRPEPWGLADIQPALLVGAQGETLMDLARSLAARAA
jgi:hypothetical protein